jgi:hypothetical protein
MVYFIYHFFPPFGPIAWHRDHGIGLICLPTKSAEGQVGNSAQDNPKNDSGHQQKYEADHSKDDVFVFNVVALLKLK